MNYSTYRFTLDLQKHQSQYSIDCFRGDTAIKLIISFTDGGKPYLIDDKAYAVLFGKRLEDGEKLIHDCEISEGGTEAIYFFKKSTTAVSGIVDCQLRLYGEDQKLITAPRFIINVDTQVVTDDDVVIEDENMSALDTIFKTEKERIDAERIRQQNEYGYRVEDEDNPGNYSLFPGRVQNEEERVIKEKARDRAENGIYDESGKLISKGRVQNEQERIEAERKRDIFENGGEWEGEAIVGRVYAEDLRDKAEYGFDYTNQIDGKVYHNPGRVDNEHERENNESTRQMNETARESAELERQKAEGGTVIDDVTYEGRVGAEAKREQAENARVEAENARVEAETARVQAEIKRDTNETNRDQRLTAAIIELLAIQERRSQAFTFETRSELGEALGIELDGNSSLSEISLSNEDGTVKDTLTMTDREGNTATYKIKDGDIIYIASKLCPDYWVSISHACLYELDTTKVDLSGYVKVEKGKGLSSNDFTDKYKGLLDNMDEGGSQSDITLILSGDLEGEASSSGGLLEIEAKLNPGTGNSIHPSSENSFIAGGANNQVGTGNNCFVAGQNNKTFYNEDPSANADDVYSLSFKDINLIGKGLVAKNDTQTILGRHNNPTKGFEFLYGCGSDATNPSNGFGLDWDGNLYVKKDIYVNGVHNNNAEDNPLAKRKLITQKELDAAIAGVLQAQKTAEDGTNIDDYKQAGLYYFSGSYTYSNLPDQGNDYTYDDSVNGWLQVLTRGENTSGKEYFVKQIFHRHGSVTNDNCHHTFVRNYCVYKDKATGNETYQWSKWRRFLTAEEIEDGTITPPSGETSYATESYVDGKMAELEAQMAELAYKAITITRFVMNTGDQTGKSTVYYEKGDSSASRALSWTTSKAPTTLSLKWGDTGGDTEVLTNPTEKTYSDLTSRSTDTTYTLTVTDEKGATDTNYVYLKFVNKVFYGTSSATEFTSDILSSFTGVLTSSKLSSFTDTAEEGEYYYYCLPESYGTCSFIDTSTKLGYAFEKPTEFEYTKGSITTKYYAYRSTYAIKGTATIQVT